MEYVVLILVVTLVALVAWVVFQKYHLGKEIWNLKTHLEALQNLEGEQRQKLEAITQSYYESLRNNTKLQGQLERMEDLQKINVEQKEKIEEMIILYQNTLAKKAEAQTQLESQTKLLNSLEQKYAQSLATLKAEFEQSIQNQSQRMLEQNKLHLMEDSKKILDSIFSPVQESLKEYKESLAANEIKLETNIKNMFAYIKYI